MNKFLLPLILLATISACTSEIILSKDADPVPKSRALAYQEPTRERSIPFVVTRDAGLVGSACYLEFSIDGTKVALFNPGETAQFYVAPGTHIAEVNVDQQGSGLCGMVNRPSHAEITVKDGGRKTFYRLLTISDQFLILPSY